jgi:iron complex transport system substrate-binding protein
MRRLLTAFLTTTALLVTAACGSGDDTPEAAGSSAPDDPGVVVALDDFAAMHALSVGVRPDFVFDVFEYETSRAIWADNGISTVPYGTELDVEKVISAKPDVIIGVSIPTNVAKKDTLAKIAPTTILDYTADWRVQLTEAAKAIGRAEAAQKLVQKVDADIAALKRDLPAGADRTVSILGQNAVDTFSVPEQSGLGTLVRDAGLDRPAAQKVRKEATSPFISVSLETLTDHDAPTMFLMTGGAYDPKSLKASPLWNRLQAVQRNKVYEVCAEMWFAASPFAVDWVVDDLRATLVDGKPAATPAQAAAKFKTFTSGG